MSAPPPYPGNEKDMPPPTAYPQQPAGYNTQYGAPPAGQAYPQQPYGQPGGYPQPPPPGQYPPQGPYPQGGYPPQGQYPPPGQPQQGPTTVVVTQQPVIAQDFRESPIRTVCPHCKAEIVTGSTYETGTMTWVICVVLCLVGCDIGCCLIPFCMDGCKDVVHNCPNCRQVIGRYNRL